VQGSGRGTATSSDDGLLWAMTTELGFSVIGKGRPPSTIEEVGGRVVVQPAMSGGAARLKEVESESGQKKKGRQWGETECRRRREVRGWTLLGGVHNIEKRRRVTRWS
jgi:hypothetical protein